MISFCSFFYSSIDTIPWFGNDLHDVGGNQVLPGPNLKGSFGNLHTELQFLLLLNGAGRRASGSSRLNSRIELLVVVVGAQDTLRLTLGVVLLFLNGDIVANVLGANEASEFETHGDYESFGLWWFPLVEIKSV